MNLWHLLGSLFTPPLCSGHHRHISTKYIYSTHIRSTVRKSEKAPLSMFIIRLSAIRLFNVCARISHYWVGTSRMDSHSRFGDSFCFSRADLVDRELVVQTRRTIFYRAQRQHTAQSGWGKNMKERDRVLGPCKIFFYNIQKEYTTNKLGSTTVRQALHSGWKDLFHSWFKTNRSNLQLDQGLVGLVQ